MSVSTTSPERLLPSELPAGKLSTARGTIYLPNGDVLYAADPDCEHEIKAKWSGIECMKCRGWFCY
jgi:hypothetical protein